METGRDREIKLIRKANRAAAVGRLMLGEITTWQEFLAADNIDLKKTPRKNLKGAVKDINLRLKKEIEKFCKKNFESISQDLLSNLYEGIKQYRGIEMPLKEFEQKYAKIKKDVIKGCPPHLTVHISLWGLQLNNLYYETHHFCSIALCFRLFFECPKHIKPDTVQDRTF